MSVRGPAVAHRVFALNIRLARHLLERASMGNNIQTGLVAVLCAAALVSTSAAAADAPRGHCGWSAVPGSVVGSAAGFWGTYGVLRLAGNSADDLNKADDARLVALLSGMGAGFVLGPVASCAIFEPEDHAVPRITFILGGAMIAGTGTGLGVYALTSDRTHDAATDERQGEGSMTLSAMSAGLAAIGGGIGGYYLYEALLPARKDLGASALVVPSALPGGAGLSLVGRF